MMTIRTTNLRAAKRRFERGMTLPEVLVAFVISSVAISAIVSGYVFAVFSAERFALSQAATARAVERLEQTRCAQWITSLSPGTNQLVASNFPAQMVTLDLSGDGTQIFYATNFTTISNISTTPPLCRIHVDCVWAFWPTLMMMTNSTEMIRAAQ